MDVATDEIDPDQLAEASRQLAAMLLAECAHAGTAPPTPAAMEAEVADAVARGFGRRRSDRPGRDNRIYRLGQVFEVLGASDLEDYALLGLFGSGKTGLTWLLAAIASLVACGAEVTCAAAIRLVLADPHKRRFCVETGAFLRWHHERTLRERALAEWQASPAAHDPHAAWRHRPPTRRQRCALAAMNAALGAVTPGFRPREVRTRGEAHDLIAELGGNPRFMKAPAPPNRKETDA